MRTSKASTVFADWIQLIRVSKSPRTANDYEKMVAKYIKDCKVTDLNKVTPAMVFEYINGVKKRSKARRRIILSVIRQFHDYAFKLGHCTQDPASVVKLRNDNLTHRQKETKIVEAFTHDEYIQLILYLDKELLEIESERALVRTKYNTIDRSLRRVGELRKKRQWNRFFKAAVMLSYETGLRLSDVCQLEWNCVTDTELIVHTDKRDKRVAIPRWKEVDEALSAIGSARCSDLLYCFPEEREWIRDPNKRSKFSVQFTRLLKRADITRKGLSFHSLRHACLTKWKSGGMDLEHIQKLAGHSSSETTKGYIHA
jgi:integrase